MAKNRNGVGMNATLVQPLEVKIPSRHELFTGMEYNMDYDTRQVPTPSVPPPVSRQSLAQQTMIHNYHWSRYLSVIKNFGLRPDYPVFHGFTIVNGAPEVSNTGVPTMSNPPMNFPRPATAGTMKPNPRYSKALPLPIPSYDPPTYGS